MCVVSVLGLTSEQHKNHYLIFDFVPCFKTDNKPIQKINSTVFFDYLIFAYLNGTINFIFKLFPLLHKFISFAAFNICNRTTARY